MNTELIKKLRNLTGAGMSDCRAALLESGEDLEKAIDIVKTKGLNIVSGRAGKATTEGLIIAAHVNPTTISLLEVLCQTDFVANSSEFKEFAQLASEQLSKDINKGKNFEFNKESIETVRKDLVAKTKENIVLSRWWAEQASDKLAKVFYYVHNNNKIGVLLTLLAPSHEVWESEKFNQLGLDLAMQVAAMSPLAVSFDKLNDADIDRQRSIFEAQLKEMNKPEAAWGKIMDGKMNRWYSEVCLLNQESVLVPKTSVEKIVKDMGVKVINFVRASVGEGVDLPKSNLAEEVAKLME